MLIEKAEKKNENLFGLSVYATMRNDIKYFHSFFISLSSAAYRSKQLQLINTVKHIGRCFTGDPSTYINRKYDRKKKKSKEQQQFITEIGS